MVDKAAFTFSESTRLPGNYWGLFFGMVNRKSLVLRINGETPVPSEPTTNNMLLSLNWLLAFCNSTNIYLLLLSGIAVDTTRLGFVFGLLIPYKISWISHWIYIHQFHYTRWRFVDCVVQRAFALVADDQGIHIIVITTPESVYIHIIIMMIIIL